MAVFEYRGIQIASGKPVKGYRDADNAKSLRAVCARDGVLLTEANEEAERGSKAGRKLDLFGLHATAVDRRRGGHDSSAGDAGARGVRSWNRWPR